MSDTKFCTSCGTQIQSQTQFCSQCGAPQLTASSQRTSASQASIPGGQPSSAYRSDRWLVTLLLCIFLGTFGVHRFYTGKIATGILMIITFGGCGIWYVIDIIMISLKSYRDSEGNIVA